MPLRFERGWVALFGSGAHFSRFVEVFDCGFIKQHAGFSAYFDGIAVVPLDYALYARSIFEDEDHLRLELDLFLQVKQLCLTIGALLVVRDSRKVTSSRGRNHAQFSRWLGSVCDCGFYYGRG